MNLQFDAIYDNGVLKPLIPLSLPDQARVRLTVQTSSSAEANATLAAQKAALQELWQEIEKLPQHRNNDGWSVREHDALLYGEKK